MRILAASVFVAAALAGCAAAGSTPAIAPAGGRAIPSVSGDTAGTVTFTRASYSCAAGGPWGFTARLSGWETPTPELKSKVSIDIRRESATVVFPVGWDYTSPPSDGVITYPVEGEHYPWDVAQWCRSAPSDVAAGPGLYTLKITAAGYFTTLAEGTFVITPYRGWHDAQGHGPIWSYQSAPGRTAGTVPTGDVVFGGAS